MILGFADDFLDSRMPTLISLLNVVALMFCNGFSFFVSTNTAADTRNESSLVVSKERDDSRSSGEDLSDKTQKQNLLSPKHKPFKIQSTINGYLEDVDAREMAFSLKEWDELKVLYSPTHGERYVKGEIILRLDIEKIRHEIRNLTHDLSMLDLNQEMLEVELELAENLLPIRKNEIDQLESYLDEDVDRFRTTELPFKKKTSLMNVRRYEHLLAYSLEELNQLKKMYEADEMTEETEEIILKRAQNEVEQMRFYLEKAKNEFDKFNEIEAPRTLKEIMNSFETDHISFSAMRKRNLHEMKKKKLEKQKMSEKRKLLALRKRFLEEDMKRMTMKSPLDGLLYWGSFDRGKWTGKKMLEGKLRKGGTLKSGEPIITISPMTKVRARMDLPEELLHELKQDTKGKLEFNTMQSEFLSATVVEISTAPISAGFYDVELEITFPEGFSIPATGTACSFTFISYENKSALTLPEEAVFEEDFDHEKKFVYELNDKNKFRKRYVEVGRKSGGRVEILRGLKAKSKITLKKP